MIELCTCGLSDTSLSPWSRAYLPSLCMSSFQERCDGNCWGWCALGGVWLPMFPPNLGIEERHSRCRKQSGDLGMTWLGKVDSTIISCSIVLRLSCDAALRKEQSTKGCYCKFSIITRSLLAKECELYWCIKLKTLFRNSRAPCNDIELLEAKEHLFSKDRSLRRKLFKGLTLQQQLRRLKSLKDLQHALADNRRKRILRSWNRRRSH